MNGTDEEASRPLPEASAAPVAVDVRSLRVRYGPLEAVKGVSFQIPRGEVFGFIGPNGAGKTSTIRVLATLLKPSAGRVSVAGVDVLRHPGRVRTRIGYVPDNFGVYDDLTVYEYMHFFAAAYRIDKGRRRTLIEDLLGLTDLSEKIHSPVHALSRGMKQRLGLARVLIHDPEVLLLDEPASGLDPRARIEVREFLKELKRMGKTILISSHILHELSQLCTRIGIIEAGRLVAEGPLSEIYRRLEVTQAVHIQLSTLPADLLPHLRSLAGVEKVREEADRIVVSLREDVLAVEDLLDRIQATGARVRMFQPEAMDMETVFMKLTEGKTA